jgi:uncharacterized protein (DUF302 family)
MRNRLITGFILLCLQLPALAAPGTQVWQRQAPLDTTYQAVYQALEAHRFFVVFEPDIGKNLSRFAERWGEDYNRNGLEGIRAMVFCNAWYANQVSNQDPEMLALCPLHLTLTHKAGLTRVLFLLPSHAARGSAAEAIAADLEAAVIEAVEAGLAGLPAAE